MDNHIEQFIAGEGGDDVAEFLDLIQALEQTGQISATDAASAKLTAVKTDNTAALSEAFLLRIMGSSGHA